MGRTNGAKYSRIGQVSIVCRLRWESMPMRSGSIPCRPTIRIETRPKLVRWRSVVHVLVDLAWIFATASDDSLRDTTEAVRLAERAASLSPEPSAAVLDVLGAAYATDGQIDRAIAPTVQR